MFITKTDKAIGMIVDQSGAKRVGVILTKEINDKPMCVDYFSPQWLAENTLIFDKYNTDYIFNVMAEHAKTIGASREALTKLILFAPDDVKKDLKMNAEAIYALYDEYMEKAQSNVKNKGASKRKTSVNDSKNIILGAAKKDVKSAKTVLKKEKHTSNVKELFTIDEINAIKAVKKDNQLLGKNKSDTARRIILKYHTTKTDDEMLAIAKKVWTETPVQNNLIRYHHAELIEKGLI